MAFGLFLQTNEQLPFAAWSCTWSQSQPEQFFVGLNNGSVGFFDTRYPSRPMGSLSPHRTLPRTLAVAGMSPLLSGRPKPKPKTLNQKPRSPHFARPVHSLCHLGLVKSGQAAGATKGTKTGGVAQEEVLLYGSMGCVGLWHRTMGKGGVKSTPPTSTPQFWSSSSSPEQEDQSPTADADGHGLANQQPQAQEQCEGFEHTTLHARKACVSVVRCAFFFFFCALYFAFCILQR